MRHNCQVYSVCRFIVFEWGPTSVTETVRPIVLLLYSYTICCFGDLNFTNKNHFVISLKQYKYNYVMFFSLYYAGYNMNKHSKVLKYLFLSLNCRKEENIKNQVFLDNGLKNVSFCFASLPPPTPSQWITFLIVISQKILLI